MGSAKNPGRILDGPYANWGTQDENCTLILQPIPTTSLAPYAQTYTVRLGQTVYLDVTQFGPDNAVMNDGVPPATNYALAEQTMGPQGELVVMSQSANAGPLFGVIVNVEPTPGLTYQIYGGTPTWTNNSGKVLLVKITVRQQGFAYVWAGTTSANNTTCFVGSALATNVNFNYCVRNNAPTMQNTVGVALATAINTTQAIGPVQLQSSRNQPVQAFGVPAPQGPGLVSIVPASIVGIVTNTQLLIDTLQSGVQEQVSVASISYPAFTVNLANAHTGNFTITGPLQNPASGSVLISAVGTTCSMAGLVACWVNLA